MDTMYKTAPPIEETELEFCRRKMQDRADHIATQNDRILGLRHALEDILEIVEEVL